MTEVRSLLVQGQLAEFAGPLPPDGSSPLLAACADVRGECGWHVAPLVERDVVLVSGSGARRLVLPSLRIVAVHTVTDVCTGQQLDDWRQAGLGMLIRDSSGWPRGDHNLRVVLDHGYGTCPDDLLAVVAERARALAAPAAPGVRGSTSTVGGVTRTTSYLDVPPAWSLAAAAVIARYSV